MIFDVIFNNFNTKQSKMNKRWAIFIRSNLKSCMLCVCGNGMRVLNYMPKMHETKQTHTPFNVV